MSKYPPSSLSSQTKAKPKKKPVSSTQKITVISNSRQSDILFSSHERESLINQKTSCFSSCMANMISIQNSLLCGMTSLLLAKLLIGIIASAFIITISINFAEANRRDSFQIIYDKVQSLTIRQEILCDTLMASVTSGLFVFEDVNTSIRRKYIWDAVKRNFPRLGVRNFILGFSDDTAAHYTTYYYLEGQIRKFTGKNEGKQIEICYSSNITGECITDSVTVPFNVNQSGVGKSKTIYEPGFLPPYLYQCPGPSCAVLITYNYPVHNFETGEYIASAGCCLDGNAIKEFLEERTINSALAFIIDVKTGMIMSSSNTEKIPIISEDLELIRANESSSTMVKKITNIVTEDLNSIGSSVKHKAMGLYFLDYARYESDGIDWIIAVYTPIWSFYSTLVLFLLSFACVFLVTFFGSCISGLGLIHFVRRGLVKLKKEMNKAEYLLFDEIEKSKSFFSEIVSLDKGFQFLKDKLKEFSSFLPSGLKQKLLGQINGNNNQEGINEIRESVASFDTSGSDNSSERTSFYGSTAGGSLASEIGIFKQKCTLALIKFFGTTDNFVSDYSSFLGFVEDCAKRGTLIKFDHKYILVGFNVSVPLQNHSSFGMKFGVDLYTKCKDSFSFSIGIDTGIGNICTLGTVSSRVEDVFGEVFTSVNNLVSSCGKHSLLVGNSCISSYLSLKDLKSSEKFRIYTVDLIYNTKSFTLEKVYFVSSAITTHDGEWMYVLEQSKKMKETENFDSLVWTLFEENKFEEALKVLSKSDNLSQYSLLRKTILQLKTKKTTFKQYKNAVLNNFQKTKNYSFCNSESVWENL